jgi:hypothetical protein
MMFQYYYRGGGLQTFAYSLQQWGLYDVVLPFLLFFAILFAVLQRTHLFGEKKNNIWYPDRKINGIIALVISLIIVLPHVTRSYPIQADPVLIVNKFLPGSAIIIIAVLMTLLLIGLTGGKIPSLVTFIVALVAIGMLALVFLASVFPALKWQWGPLRDPNIVALIVILLIFGLVVWFIVREPEKRKPEEMKTWLKDVWGFGE